MNVLHKPAGTRALPLQGITVIDVTRVVAGPYCAMMLADLGATVIKIEHPSDPDYVRSFPPHVPDGQGGTAGSAYFAQYNRHKLGASLDLKHPEGSRRSARSMQRGPPQTALQTAPSEDPPCG